MNVTSPTECVNNAVVTVAVLLRVNAPAACTKLTEGLIAPLLKERAVFFVNVVQVNVPIFDNVPPL